MIEVIVIGVVSVIVIVGLIIGGISYVQSEVKEVRRYVKMEIKKMVDVINDAQYTEFNFDKQNEQNIRKLEKHLLDVSAKVDSLLAA